MRPLISRLNQWLTRPALLRVSLVSGIIVIIMATLSGSIVAVMTRGYNILNNYISDLGVSQHTPMPFLFDDGLIIGAIFFIPILVSLGKQVRKLAKESKSRENTLRWQVILSATADVGICLALIGIFGVGLFPESPKYDSYLHIFFAEFIFVGMIGAGIGLGVKNIIYKKNIPKSLGIYMLIGPLLVGVIYAASGAPLAEWLLMFSILAWLTVLFGYRHPTVKLTKFIMMTRVPTKYGRGKPRKKIKK